MTDLCAGKSPQGRAEASRVAKRNKGRVYRCKVCRWWHVASGVDKACTIKQGYSRTGAYRAAERLRQRPYHCPHCSRWHLSSGGSA